MEKKLMPVLEPDFYKDFHCVAAACRENCCVYPWQIFVEKKNYKELRRLKEPKWLAENFSDYFVLNDDSSGFMDYAHMRYNEHGCAMQTEEGLCRLQMDTGAQYLSDTCKTYPRMDSYLATAGAATAQCEQGLALSCEEVTRMLLQKRESIEFTTSEEAYSPANFGKEHRIVNHFILDNGNRPILAHYNLVRMMCIALLQNRDYPLEQRMMTLILYLDKLAQAEREGREEEVPAMTDAFAQAVEERLYDELLTSVGGAMSSVILSSVAFTTIFSSKGDHPIALRCNANIAATSYEIRLDSYRAFLVGREHLVEHLLVMELFNKALPFKKSRSISDCMLYMVSIFTIFRFMLGAYLGESHDLSDTEFIDFVAFFGKSALHSSASFDSNLSLLKQNGMDTLPHLMSILLG